MWKQYVQDTVRKHISDELQDKVRHFLHRSRLKQALLHRGFLLARSAALWSSKALAADLPYSLPFVTDFGSSFWWAGGDTGSASGAVSGSKSSPHPPNLFWYSSDINAAAVEHVKAQTFRLTFPRSAELPRQGSRSRQVCTPTSAMPVSELYGFSLLGTAPSISAVAE